MPQNTLSGFHAVCICNYVDGRRRRLSPAIFIPCLGWGGTGRTASDASCLLPGSIPAISVLLHDRVATGTHDRPGIQSHRRLCPGSFKPLFQAGFPIIEDCKSKILLVFIGEARLVPRQKIHKRPGLKRFAVSRNWFSVQGEELRKSFFTCRMCLNTL